MTLSKDHYLVSREGTFDTSGSPYATTQADLDSLFATLATDERRNKLVLHFHGGLVDFVSGMLAAEAITTHYADVPAYQVFFLWQTALFDVLSEKTFLDAIIPNINAAFNNPFFQQVLLRVTQFVKGKVDASNGGAIDRWLDLPSKEEVLQELQNPKDGQEPYSDIPSTALPQLHVHEEQIILEHLMHHDPVIKQHARYLVTKHTPLELKKSAPSTNEEASPTNTPPFSLAFIERFLGEVQHVTLEGIEQAADFFLIGRCITVLRRVLTRFAEHRDHGVYPTIVEEILREFFIGTIGTEVWSGIKMEAASNFNDSPNAAGTAFLKGLQGYCEKNPNAQITLVGHSAGGTYICEFLKHANILLPQNVTFDVVMLAPANSYKSFSDTLAVCQSRIRGVRVFGMNDVLEQKDALIPHVYPLSLLYLVSGILEDEPDTPILGMQRYFTNKAPYTQKDVEVSYVYLNGQQNSHVWSLSSRGEGISSDAKSHATFYSEKVTLNSVQYIIEHGLGEPTSA